MFEHYNFLLFQAPGIFGQPLPDEDEIIAKALEI